MILENEVPFVKLGARVPKLWLRLLGPSGPNLVYRPQTPRAKYFLKFHDFICLVWEDWS